MANEEPTLTTVVDSNLYPPSNAVVEGNTEYTPTYISTIILTDLDQSYYNEN